MVQMCNFNTDNESQSIYNLGLFNDVLSIVDILWRKMRIEDKNDE
jgi:hypothetical protein